MKKLYLAKPDDGTEVLTEEESRFLHTMNLKTPRVYFPSNKLSNDDLEVAKTYEAIPDGLPQYFWYNDVEMDYVYPLEDKIVSLSKIDHSIPILQPFSYTKFQKSLLNFDKIIFLEDLTVQHLVRNEGLKDFVDKFYVLDRYDGRRKPFMEYGNSEDVQFVKYQYLANKLIDAIKKDDFSKLKYKL